MNERGRPTAHRRWMQFAACVLAVFFSAPAGADANPGAPGIAAEKAEHDGARDFDFEFGEWRARILRLAAPLSGSSEWVEYEGSSVVRKIWDGRANLGELNVSGPGGSIEGLSLRLYDPQTRAWRIHWANSRNGQLGEAMVGGFDESGRGEFYNREEFDGRPVLVRFIFSEIAQNSFRLEQAFSEDDGNTWEANWIATFTR